MLRNSDAAALNATPTPSAGGDGRAAFSNRLAQQLRPHGISVISAALGNRNGAAVWVLAVQVGSRQFVATLDVVLPRGFDAFADETCKAVAQTVVEWATGHSV
jgi:hypothetical protein